MTRSKHRIPFDSEQLARAEALSGITDVGEWFEEARDPRIRRDE